MSTLDQLKDGLTHAWDSVSDGWRVIECLVVGDIPVEAARVEAIRVRHIQINAIFSAGRSTAADGAERH